MPVPRYGLIVLLAANALTLSANSMAEYIGPAAQVVATAVKAILANPVDDQQVVARGHILRQVSKDKYIFSDGTAEIRVDIDAKYFPVEKISDKTIVEIRGEVEKDFLESPEIDVHAVTVVR